MTIAILSGKGGTGKTTLSTNLAGVADNAVLIDCDVEEPNAHLFFRPKLTATKALEVRYPEIDNDLCTHCRKCAEFCRFHAIIAGPKVTLVLKELCHDCGGCFAVCPSGAVSFGSRTIGAIHTCEILDGKTLVYGVLDTGELSGVKIIDEVKHMVEDAPLVLIDSPPGTSCSAVAAVEGADYAVIVSEPTPFGVSDMKMVVELLRTMDIPFGVVVNKSGIGDREIYDYCESEGLTILGEIPFDRDLARGYAEGTPACTMSESYRDMFYGIWTVILDAAEETVNGRS
ncbi:MAG: ATP-binding protein [Spirochaetales bacterium]|nr:ATP-binding protein [Spirochaetales bacterium]